MHAFATWWEGSLRLIQFVLFCYLVADQELTRASKSVGQLSSGRQSAAQGPKE